MVTFPKIMLEENLLAFYLLLLVFVCSTCVLGSGYTSINMYVCNTGVTVYGGCHDVI